MVSYLPSTQLCLIVSRPTVHNTTRKACISLCIPKACRRYVYTAYLTALFSLFTDLIFRSIQDIALNEKAIASAESAIRTYEEELLKLEQIRPLDSGILSSGATRQRADFLLKKLYDAESKIEKLEAVNATLKKNLKKP